MDYIRSQCGWCGAWSSEIISGGRCPYCLRLPKSKLRDFAFVIAVIVIVGLIATTIGIALR